MSFGTWLESELTERKLSGKAFSDQVGLSTAAVSHWIREQRRPDADSCRRIARVFGLDEHLVLEKAGHKSFSEIIQYDLEFRLSQLRSLWHEIDTQLELMESRKYEVSEEIEVLENEVRRMRSNSKPELRLRDRFAWALRDLDLSDEVLDIIASRVVHVLAADPTEGEPRKSAVSLFASQSPW